MQAREELHFTITDSVEMFQFTSVLSMGLVRQ